MYHLDENCVKAAVKCREAWDYLHGLFIWLTPDLVWPAGLGVIYVACERAEITRGESGGDEWGVNASGFPSPGQPGRWWHGRRDVQVSPGAGGPTRRAGKADHWHQSSLTAPRCHLAACRLSITRSSHTCPARQLAAPGRPGQPGGSPGPTHSGSAKYKLGWL